MTYPPVLSEPIHPNLQADVSCSYTAIGATPAVCGRNATQPSSCRAGYDLTHARVSTHSTTDLTTPASLVEVFDYFVLDGSLREDGEIMEAAGAQCLLLTGFFADQLRRRHNIGWYAHLGVGFFNRAASLERSPQKVRLLAAIAAGFESWRQRYARLSRDLREQQYLLMEPPQPGT